MERAERRLGAVCTVCGRKSYSKHISQFRKYTVGYEARYAHAGPAHAHPRARSGACAQLSLLVMSPGETAGACAYYGDGEARWVAYIEIGCRFTEEANR